MDPLFASTCPPGSSPGSAVSTPLSTQSATGAGTFKRKEKKRPPGVGGLKQVTEEAKIVTIDGPNHMTIDKLPITNEGIGRYPYSELQINHSSRLGEGAQAKVKLCTHVPTGEVLAIKECVISDNSNLSGIQSEMANVTSRLKAHPNIVSSHDAYFKDGMLLILMEYCQHGSLAQLLDEGGKGRPHNKVPPKTLAVIAAQVVAGLHHLHTQDDPVIHRDMKPSNILVDADYNIKICDFGVSRVIKQGEQLAHTAVGASAYLSPERCRGEGYYMPSDVWALGVTVAELALGDYPWRRIDVYVLSEMLASGQPTVDWSDGDYPEELKDFVAKCLATNPLERATTGELLKHPFVAGCKPDKQRVRSWVTGWRTANDPQGRVFWKNARTSKKQYGDPFATA